MSGASRYRNFFKLVESWPIDPSKQGRDLGAVVRQRVAEAFKMGENTQVADTAKCDQDYESLHRIASDFHKNKYATSKMGKTVGATGLSYDDCRAITASESMDEMKQTEETGLFAKLKQTFTAERPKM